MHDNTYSDFCRRGLSSKSLRGCHSNTFLPRRLLTENLAASTAPIEWGFTKI
ncbi:hypothetical protein AG1IA_03016 [Rhizoctonia solani AG-1 IA]|uniref:Uncharacterized protein n=1 Tax=Thanatephorus cucumeris (strain AG1-IA) TaxID=983506 RepID=L8X1R7_THACA|nr:hypothetical protein AG1IA_03016 [Rhizoctonia solani AG-1 IA]